MISIEEVVDHSCSRIPIGGAERASWVREVLTAFLPLILKASLMREESRFQAFSVAVVKFPSEYAWSGLHFDGAENASAESLAKLASLSKPGESYLLCRKHEERLLIVGAGQPDPVWGMRLEPWIASAIVGEPLGPFAFIAFTVLGPWTVLIEGFRTELAFLLEGELQARADLIDAASLPFLKEQVRSKNVEIRYRDHPPLPMETLCPVAACQVLEHLARGAARKGRGGLLAFSPSGWRRSGPGATKANWLTKAGSMLDQYLDLLVAMSRFNETDNGVRSAYHGAKKVFTDNLRAVLRASTLDGAVLFDRRLRVCAFGAKLRSSPLRMREVPHLLGGSSLDLGTKGTRHLSAASWVAAGKARMALVVSQDRASRLFHSTADGGVGYLNVRPSLFED